jgi:hypothetical protein
MNTLAVVEQLDVAEDRRPGVLTVIGVSINRFCLAQEENSRTRFVAVPAAPTFMQRHTNRIQ